MSRFFAALTLAFTLFLVGPAAQAVSASGDDSPGIISGKGNFYLVGKNVLVNSGEAPRDLMAAGVAVTVNQPVQEDAALAGMNVNIVSPVAGDLRAIGSDVAVSAPIGGEALLIGGTIHVYTPASIAGELMIFGDRVVIDGPVGGYLTVRAADIVVNGQVATGADLTASHSLVLGPNAAVKGNLKYNAPAPVTVGPAQAVTVEYLGPTAGGETTVKPSSPRAGNRVGWWLLDLALFLALGMTAFLISRRSVGRVASLASGSFWRELGVGFLALIGGPVAAVTVGLTVVGLPISVIVLSAYITLLLLAWILSGAVTGQLIVRLVPRWRQHEFDWKTVAGGTVALQTVWIIPFLGGFAALVVFLITLGALVEAIWAALAGLRNKKHAAG